MPEILEKPLSDSPTRAVDSLKLSLATELAPHRWKKSLVRFAELLQSGNTWVDAATKSKPSRSLKNLLVSVSLCPDPVETLWEILRAKRGHKTMAEATQPLIYPALLLVATFIVTSGLAWIGTMATINVDWMDWRTGRTDDLISRLFLSQWSRSVTTASLAGWLILVALILYFLGAPSTRLSLALEMPIFGKLFRWTMFRDLFRNYSVFLSSGITAEKAAQATVECFRDTLLAIPARGLGQRLAAGQSLDRAIYNSVLCDEFLGPAALSLTRSDEQSSVGTKNIAVLANQLFEQRRTALSQVANRVGLLLVLCMYMRLGIDVVLMIQGFNGTISQFDFFGASENWFLFLPLASVNFVFLNSMFHPKSRGSRSGVTATIKLFSATCLAVALIGLALRLSFADLLYVIPLLMAVMALRANSLSVTRFAAASTLMFGANRPDMPRWIAKNLMDDHRGFVYRRVRRFALLVESGFPFDAAVARSRLLRDPHEKWLVALITRFESMPESQAILSNCSPWTDAYQGLLQRINALKWMLFVFALSVFFFLFLEIVFLLPTTRKLLEESPQAEMSEMWSSDFGFTNGFAKFTEGWISHPMAGFFFAILFMAFLLGVVLNAIPFVRMWLIRFWTAPIDRAWTLRGISEVLMSNANFPQILKDSCQMHPIRSHREKLGALVRDLEAGKSESDAFARSKMIQQSQRGLLTLAKEPSQLAWTLHQIAERNYFKWIEWYLMWIDIMTLLLVLFTAVVVAAFGTMQFQVISYIVQITSGY